MSIAPWLQELGLAQYEAAFRDNDIDMRVLPGLTGEDLREVGVTSVGHRRLLLQAIEKLNSSEPAPSTAAADSAPQPAAGAERRRLTVMFVDLVGSTALMRRLDPEDSRDLLRRYQELVAGEIARVEGYLAKFMGDGVLAYFGWPRAHEDDAERAVRAGLAIASDVGQLRLQGGGDLACRIGIATGPVVVGDLLGEGAAREESVVGDTPSLAARLQTLAPPGGVLLANTTRQLVGGFFELLRLEAVELKGFDDAETAWRALGESRSRSRFEARQGATARPMFGRDHELALLRQRWAQAKGGEGQAVLLVGEAGIGKSRLVQALQDDVIGYDGGLVHWQASPLHRATPLRPVVQDLIDHSDSPTVAVLERRLAESGADLQQAVPLVAAQIGMPTGNEYPALQIVPEAQRPRLMQTLLAHLVGLAMRRPLLVLFEDAHWADATTLELARLLLHRIGNAPVLLVITSRPENLPSIPAEPHLTRLTLNRLSRAAVADIVTRLLPEHGSSALIETIASRTDGVPLFVEELTKAIAERKGEAPEGAQDGLDVPASLHDTLMARLDRLGGAKEVAQLAACIGRDIDHRLLIAIANQPEAELTQKLDELCEAELLFRHGAAPETRYSFKHALVRDAAYESQLKSGRRATHAKILDALERGVVPAAEEQLGYHAAGARLWPKALQHYGVAGKAALGRASNEEGVALVGRALEAGRQLEGDRDAEVAMIDLRTARSWAYFIMGETQRMLGELSDVETRAAVLGFTRLKCQLRTQRTHVESIFGDSAKQAVSHGKASVEIAANLDDPDLSSAARFVLGHALFIAGDYRGAIEQLSVDAEASQKGLRVAGVGSSGILAVDVLATLGDACAQIGRWDVAWVHGAAARAVATESGSPWDMNVTNYHSSRALLANGNADAALPLTEWSIEYGNRAGLRFALPWHLANLGQIHLLKGRTESALEVLDQAISGCAQLGLQYPGGHAYLVRAQACLDAKRADAEEAARQALAFARSHAYRAFEATALRLLAIVSTSNPERPRYLAEARQIAGLLDLPLELASIAALEADAGVTRA